MANVKELDVIGKVIVGIEKFTDSYGGIYTTCSENNEYTKLLFVFSDGTKKLMYHQQTCSEAVILQDVIGDLSDLLDSPILMAEVVTNEGSENDTDLIDGAYDYETSKWTFYKFGTIKGYVTLRWLGASNGYYSVDVEFVEIPSNMDNDTVKGLKDEGDLYRAIAETE